MENQILENLKMMMKMKKFTNMIKKNQKRKRVGSGSLRDETKNKKFTHFSGIIPKGICGPN
ncbi:hypothetical protein NPIRD3C_1970 [Nitrosopumilus piranensis]|uniref:Uncharacterized protein n=1 Tax=Nitrosopumilus piranensis TaxID=1582439 RepID=A0A0C5C1E6_9ARCH|nr:hypothetical protein NPIRD3C_1970 [Nitrosopumilus piranensis]